MEILRMYLLIKKKWFKKEKLNEEKENQFYFANDVLRNQYSSISQSNYLQ